MEDSWTKIYSTTKPYMGEIVKDVLQEQGINAVVINKQDSSYLFGEIEVYVLKSDALRAVNLIKKNEL